MGLYGVLLGGMLAIVSGAAVQILQSRLTSKRERDRWIADNKKAEYRELLSSMARTERLVTQARAFMVAIGPEEQKAAWEAQNETLRVIQDRIFIVDVMREMKVVRLWVDSFNALEGRGEIATFLNETGRIREMVLKAALKDLGMKEI